MVDRAAWWLRRGDERPGRRAGLSPFPEIVFASDARARGAGTAVTSVWRPIRHLDARCHGHHDAIMRTTLTLDPDVARMVEDEVRRARKPMKQVVNDALRRGLASPASGRARTRLRVPVHSTRLRPGFDASRLNALADEMEDDAVVIRAARK